jgi:hypothetical protein
MAAKNDSLWNWFGRQIGHVAKAVKTDVTKKPAAPAALPKQGAAPAAQPQAAVPPQPEPVTPDVPKVIYRDEKAEEIELPDRPGMKLRRTVIDEVIVDDEKREVSSEKREEER